MQFEQIAYELREGLMPIRSQKRNMALIRGQLIRIHYPTKGGRIALDFYSGGRHEMLHEVNRRDAITNLLVWLSGILERSS